MIETHNGRKVTIPLLNIKCTCQSCSKHKRFYVTCAEVLLLCRLHCQSMRQHLPLKRSCQPTIHQDGKDCHVITNHRDDM